MNWLTEKEKDWIKEHGCVHGMYPDEDPIFCPKCKPDTTDLLNMVSKRCKGANNEQKTL